MTRNLTIRALLDLDPADGLGLCWEKLVRGSCASGIMQSLHWRQAKLLQGYSALHLGVFMHDDLIGGAIFYNFGNQNGTSLLVAPEGPVLGWSDKPLAAEVLRLIIDTAQARAQELGAVGIRIEPRLPAPLPAVLREFVRAPFDLVPHETLYIDLSLAEDEILSAMKPKGRYNIRLAAKHGVVVHEDPTGASTTKFYRVLQEASVRDSFALEPLEFFETLVPALCEKKCARLMFAEHEGDVLGALLLVAYGSRATYLYGGTSDAKRNFMGGYALQWHAMKAAKYAGCTVYDFYGYDPFRHSEHSYARFSQFKSQFGGGAVRFVGAHDYLFMDNLADTFIKLVSETSLATSINQE